MSGQPKCKKERGLAANGHAGALKGCSKTRFPSVAPSAILRFDAGFREPRFSRFAIRNAIADSDLCEAVHRATRGLIDADLGGGVIKQRISRKGEGRSGGFRTLILFRNQARAVFVHGFAKKDAANIDARELKALKKLAGIMLRYTEAEMTGIVAAGTLLEVDCDGKTVS